MKKVQNTVRKQYKAPAFEVVEVEMHVVIAATIGGPGGKGDNTDDVGAKRGVWADFNDDLGPTLGPSNSEEEY